MKSTSSIPVYLLILFITVYLSPCFSSAQNPVHTNEKSKNLVLTKRYLNLPVQNNVPMQTMSLTVEGESVRDFDIELAVDKPDFWVFVDISTFKGKNAVLTVKQAPSNSEGFEMIYQSDTIKDEETLYREKLRPQFHFSSRRGWNNDPNGLVYYAGEYHLFYQHNPYGWNWGNMHWGHAVSSDLINWKELPDALYPDRLGTMFSGSAVIDQNNTSGFQTGSEKVMVAVYTANNPETQVQCIAYSNDKGRTWTKYEGNPVIGDRRKIIGSTNDRDPKTRDPKVFRHSPTNKWVMVLFEGTGNSIFTSDNLKEWKYESHINGFWECPEMFELPVDGNSVDKKWVMYGASGTYMIGNFDGKKFTKESGKHYYHKGILYAAQTYNNIPDGRRIQIGWGRAGSPGMPFNQMMTFPAELSLRTTNDGVRLFIEPITAIETLHKKDHKWENIYLEGENKNLLANVQSELLHIKLEFEIQTSNSFGLNINGYKIGYDLNFTQLNEVFLSPDDNRIYLEILIDRNSVEIFANHGRLYLSAVHNPADQQKGIELFSIDGKTLVKTLEIYEMKSIW